MQKTIIQRSEIKLVGLTARTNNRLEMDPSTAKIGAIFEKYMLEAWATQIPNRKTPGTIYSVYTDYESDHTGDYTYFLGEEVSKFGNTPSELQTLIIAPQTYAVFTTNPGPLPALVIDAWQQIWQMTSEQFGGERRYHADFEVYDNRAIDFQNAVVDVYVGLNATNT